MRKNIVESMVDGKTVRAEIPTKVIDDLKRLDMIVFRGTQGLGKVTVHRYVRKGN